MWWASNKDNRVGAGTGCVEAAYPFDGDQPPISYSVDAEKEQIQIIAGIGSWYKSAQWFETY